MVPAGLRSGQECRPLPVAAAPEGESSSTAAVLLGPETPSPPVGHFSKSCCFPWACLAPSYSLGTPSKHGARWASRPCSARRLTDSGPEEKLRRREGGPWLGPSRTRGSGGRPGERGPSAPSAPTTCAWAEWLEMLVGTRGGRLSADRAGEAPAEPVHLVRLPGRPAHSSTGDRGTRNPSRGHSGRGVLSGWRLEASSGAGPWSSGTVSWARETWAFSVRQNLGRHLSN